MRAISPPLLAASLALAVFLAPASAAAVGPDAAVSAAVARVLAEDVPQANYGVARTKLKAYLAQCQAQKCQGQTVAKVDVALGVIASQLGQAAEAKAQFLEALKADATTTLPATGVTPAMQASFDEAKKALPPPPPPPPVTPPASAGMPPGWTNKEAWELYHTAQAAEFTRLWDACVEKDKAALALEEQPVVRLHLAQCENGARKILDALADAQAAMQAGIAKRDLAVTKASRELVEELLKKVAHVTFIPPPGVQQLKVTFDERPVPTDGGNKQFTVDPGKHRIYADGLVQQVPVSFSETYDVKDGESITVEIALKPRSARFLTGGQEICLKDARTQEEVLACLPSNAKPLHVVVGLDFGGYLDTTAVRVLTPEVHGAVGSPTGGWNIGASYLVDVVSAASPDVVSTASRAFHDTRHAVAANGSYKPSRWGVNAAANYSTESDYTSRGAHVGVSGDFRNKQVTPSLGLAYRSDTVGRAGTPFSVFHTQYSVAGLDIGSTFVLTSSSILVLGGSIDVERGDQSKPYRLIPMFERGASVPVGASVATVNDQRLTVRPYEQLPLDRDRYALALRYVQRRGASTLRLEERVYYDSWQTLATTTDARYLIDWSRRLMIGPHARIHAQTGANFYQRVYHAEIAPVLLLPTFRTTDRELSPIISVTGGGNGRFELSSPGAKVQYGLTLSADVLYTHYFNALYIRNRLGVYSTFGFEAVFE